MQHFWFLSIKLCDYYLLELGCLQSNLESRIVPSNLTASLLRLREKLSVMFLVLVLLQREMFWKRTFYMFHLEQSYDTTKLLLISHCYW